MVLLRWCLALLALGLWGALAYGNAYLVFSKRWRNQERRPSMVMLVGALLAAIFIKLLPIPLLPGVSWGLWLLLSLLDLGSLGGLILAGFSFLADRFPRKEP